MAKRAMRVGQLADAAGIDRDEALILLWDAGFDELDSPADLIGSRYLDHARQAVGLIGTRRVTHPEYWMQALAMDKAAFDRVLCDLSIAQKPSARRLPKGAIAKLRRFTKQQGLLPEAATPSTPEATQDLGTSQPFEWRKIGHHKRAATLAAEQLEAIHWQLVEDFADDDDPIEPRGVRDRELLESAAFRPATSLSGIQKYPTAEMAAAPLMHSVVHNHPFHNGNKRTALVALLVQLDETNQMLTCVDSDLFRLVLRVAQHRIVPTGSDLTDRETMAIADWICQHSRNVDKSHRPLPWRRLRRILLDFHCLLGPAPGAGGSLEITRPIQQIRRWGKTRVVSIHTQVRYSGEGAVASRSTIAKIRTDLQLDEKHGVDSASFYSAAPGSAAEEFIAKYRKILKRLAKL